ncbi:MAG: Na(+)-translocating NADH-quinone reductase subunit A [Gammaproteobacteria bacterium]
MARHVIRKGLDVPLSGAPETSRIDSKKVSRVAVLGRDFREMRPRVRVEPGQTVRRGDLLISDALHHGIRLCAPASGTVLSAPRAERRRLRSVVVRIDHDNDSTKAFDSYTGRKAGQLSDQEIRDLLIESGLWTSFRTRPFNRVPAIDAVPSSIFVTAITTEPHAPPVEIQLEGLEDDLNRGLEILPRLTGGPIWFCKAADSSLTPKHLERLSVEEFAGPHPAGLPGTHIHLLDPVDANKRVWHLSAIDVVMIGRLFAHGELFVERVISLAGPGVRKPRLLKSRLGASTLNLTEGELDDGEMRIITGSVLSGHPAGTEETGFLGRHDLQVTALLEGGGRIQPAWARLGFDVFTVTGAYMSAFFKRKVYEFDTTAHGAQRAMIPLGAYEDIMPLDLLPVPLLRALAARDAVRAERLGCLELAEEDLALCTFVDAGKNDWQRALRLMLMQIAKEG